MSASSPEIDSNFAGARLLALIASEFSTSESLSSLIVPVDMKSSLAGEIAGELVLRYLRSRRLLQATECLASESGGTIASTRGDRWLRQKLRLKSVSKMIVSLAQLRRRKRVKVQKKAEKKRFVIIGPDKSNQVRMVKKAKTPDPPPRAPLSIGQPQSVESPKKRMKARPRVAMTPVKLEIETLDTMDFQEEEEKPPMHTVITVCVVEAKNLPQMDLIGTSDPFCVIGLVGDAKPQKTQVVEDSVTPVWNEVFKFECESETTLDIGIWDSDPLGTDQKMSSLLLPIRAENYEIDEWFEMHPETDVKINGTIRLAVKVTREEIKPEEPKPSKRIARKPTKAALMLKNLKR